MKLIIVGCGRVGSELALDVSADGHEVVVVDREPEAFHRLGSDFHGRTLQGDAREQSVLLRAGVEQTDGLAALTSSDEMNLVTARIARKIYNVPNVVARVYDPIHMEVFKLAGLQTVVSSSWSAHRIQQLLTHPGLIELASLGHRELGLIEILVPEHLVGESVDRFDIDGACRPSVVIRAGHAQMAEAGLVLEEGDLVVLTVVNDELPELIGLLEGEG
jgi:trk system potassium uptake protein TrkA